MDFLVWLNKQASKLIDNRLKRKKKDYYSQIEAVNIDAAAIHKKLLLNIDDFTFITNYCKSIYFPYDDLAYEV